MNHATFTKMKNKSQTQWAIDQLLKNGEVTRNGALQNYISRLGAIIFDLQNEDWQINGEYRKEKNGKDFVYYLVKSPFKKVEYTIPETGKKIIKYEK